MSTTEPGLVGALRARWAGIALAVLAIAMAAGAFLAGQAAGRAQGAERTRLLVVGAVLAAGVAGVAIAREARSERRIADAEQVALEAAEELTLTLNGALAPITSYLGELAAASTWEGRTVSAGQLRQAVVGAAVLLLGEESRSAIYLREQDRLVRAAYAGRSTLPRERFVAGTPDGDAVLDLVQRGDQTLIVDIEEDEVVSPSRPGDYRTVVAAAVTAGPLRLGMLTVDAPTPGDLTPTDLEVVRVLANLLGCGLAQVR